MDQLRLSFNVENREKQPTYLVDQVSFRAAFILKRPSGRVPPTCPMNSLSAVRRTELGRVQLKFTWHYVFSGCSSVLNE